MRAAPIAAERVGAECRCDQPRLHWRAVQYVSHSPLTTVRHRRSWRAIYVRDFWLTFGLSQ